LPTGQIVATGVLTKLGLTDPSGNSSASDSAYVLQELNALWDAASVDEGLIYALIAPQFPFTAYQQNYSLGPTSADWSITSRPARIYSASAVIAVAITSATTTLNGKTITMASTAGLSVGMRLLGTGIAYDTTILAIVANTSITASIAATASGTVNLTATGLNRNPLMIVDSARYLAHNDLGAAATTPDEIYPNYLPDTNGNMEVRIWPVVNEFQSSYIEMVVGVPFTVWTLGGNYNIPPGYLDWLTWIVAFRCLPGFGAAVNAQVAQVVATEAQKAEMNIRTANMKNRQLQPGDVMPPGSREAAALASAAQGGKGQ
jgi:hypothetical protein